MDVKVSVDGLMSGNQARLPEICTIMTRQSLKPCEYSQQCDFFVCLVVIIMTLTNTLK